MCMWWSDVSAHIFIFPVIPSSIPRCIHGTCLPINSYSYSCRCQPGFAGVLCDEQDQDTANPCSLSRCKHGKCRVSGLGKAYCECNSGYTGEACDRGEKNKTCVRGGGEGACWVCLHVLHIISVYSKPTSYKSLQIILSTFQAFQSKLFLLTEPLLSFCFVICYL